LVVFSSRGISAATLHRTHILPGMLRQMAGVIMAHEAGIGLCSRCAGEQAVVEGGRPGLVDAILEPMQTDAVAAVDIRKVNATKSGVRFMSVPENLCYLTVCAHSVLRGAGHHGRNVRVRWFRRGRSRACSNARCRLPADACSGVLTGWRHDHTSWDVMVHARNSSSGRAFSQPRLPSAPEALRLGSGKNTDVAGGLHWPETGRGRRVLMNY
jgi:hypothetical protein